MNEEPQATSSSDDPLTDLYRKYCPSMVRVDLKTADGDFASAAAFHIGDGWLVTARHVIDGGELAGLTAHKYAQVSKLRQVIYPKEEREDVALLETDFSLKHYMTRTHIHGLADSWKADHIPIGGHLDDWIGDELVMTRVLLMGYPRVPQSGEGLLVAVGGEVNAVLDKLGGPNSPSFVISPLPRGGFSGGPVISEHGFLLGVMSEALVRAAEPTELGFGSALSVEPIWGMLMDNDIYPASNGMFVRYLQGDEEAARQLLGETT